MSKLGLIVGQKRLCSSGSYRTPPPKKAAQVSLLSCQVVRYLAGLGRNKLWDVVLDFCVCALSSSLIFLNPSSSPLESVRALALVTVRKDVFP